MKLTKENTTKAYTTTQNACKLCSPLGASLVFKGIRNCIPLIHGSQGCATYIRRYLISHFREPMDIASSNFSEDATIFGGNKLFNEGINNVIRTYNPEVIGIASTCLSETIGEDIPKLIYEYRKINKEIPNMPAFINASTPSYAGTHAEGFHEAVFAMVKALASPTVSHAAANLFPGLVSPEDIRYLKELFASFWLPVTVMPDYSETLDNPTWNEYKNMPEGGTGVEEIKKSTGALASIELGEVFNKGWFSGKVSKASKLKTAGEYLQDEYSVPLFQTPLPIGIKLTDALVNILKNVSGNELPEDHRKERGRLIDAYIDAHKITFGKKAIIYGEEDFVISMAAFLSEIGIKTVLAASGGESKRLATAIHHYADNSDDMVIGAGWDFEQINEAALSLKPDIIIGNSKGYYISRKLNIPLVRVGFPIHDRVGAQRVLHLGYRGTQHLFDRIVNALLEHRQDNSSVGYKYM